MISKKAKEYEEKKQEEQEEHTFMYRYNKCPHCVGTIEHINGDYSGDYKLKCTSCGLTR